MNLKEVKEMINLMNENGLTELEIEKDGLRIRLKRSLDRETGIMGPVVVETRAIQTPLATQAQPEVAQKKAVGTVEIKAPMVGTFYRAPSPEAPPYIEIGQIIEPGQVICIIEAMKLMNEIKSEIKGKVLEILVDNAEPVEFGQPIILLEPL